VTDDPAQPLIERLADLIAAAYVAEVGALPDETIGVWMIVVLEEQLDALVAHTVAVTRGKAEHAAAAGLPVDDLFNYNSGPEQLTVDLPVPDVSGFPDREAAGRALLAELEAQDWELDVLRRYFLELCDRLRAAWGVPVLYDGWDGPLMDPDAQLRRQLSDAEAAAWIARGWMPAEPPGPPV
jgi:hypothetical protein